MNYLHDCGGHVADCGCASARAGSAPTAYAIPIDTNIVYRDVRIYWGQTHEMLMEHIYQMEHIYLRRVFGV